MTEENSVEDNAQAGAAGAEQANGPQFALQRIYVKDLSFEAPNGPIVLKEGKPAVNQDLNTQVKRLKENLYEVILNITITVKFADSTAYLAEVHQAGLFVIAGVPEEHMKQVVSTECPHILFPYAREAIDSLVIRGGFPALALPPVNFDRLFAQLVAQERAKTGAKADA
ncbi:MAG: preprotein translocase subunit SecB [Flavobacteriales bacterium]|jgi:preprotein translocase subunit SecB